MKGTIKTVVTLAVLGAALYFTNPEMEDFGSYYQKKLVTESQKGIAERFKGIVKTAVEPGAAFIAKFGFKRDDKLLFSFFTLGPASNPSSRYLGFGKFIFIELD